MLAKVVVGLALVVALAVPIAAQFYYGSQGPIPLKIDSSRVTIKFHEEAAPDGQQDILTAIGRIPCAVGVLACPESEFCALRTSPSARIASISGSRWGVRA
jgi:hypothetical protein